LGQRRLVQSAWKNQHQLINTKDKKNETAQNIDGADVARRPW
jgi:hypothetical protein